jgi:hypothetical protein
MEPDRWRFRATKGKRMGWGKLNAKKGLVDCCKYVPKNSIFLFFLYPQRSYADPAMISQKKERTLLNLPGFLEAEKANLYDLASKD